jgi:hypothetical protein
VPDRLRYDFDFSTDFDFFFFFYFFRSSLLSGSGLAGAGLYGNFGQTAYSAAKMAVVGLTQSLALEGAKYNVKVNCVVPLAASRMTETVLPAEVLERLRPSHVAPLVTYLCHDNCEPSGQTFELGGGFYSAVRWQVRLFQLFQHFQLFELICLSIYLSI